MQNKYALYFFQGGKIDPILLLDKAAEMVIRESIAEAKKSKKQSVDAGHLFLSILKNTENRETKILNRMGIDDQDVAMQ